MHFRNSDGQGKKNLPKTLSKLLKIRMMVIVARKNRTVKWKKCKYLIIPTTTLPFSFTVTKQHQINLKCLSFMIHVHQCLCSFLSLKYIQTTLPHETKPDHSNHHPAFQFQSQKFNIMLHAHTYFCNFCHGNTFKVHFHTKVLKSSWSFSNHMQFCLFRLAQLQTHDNSLLWLLHIQYNHVHVSFYNT